MWCGLSTSSSRSSICDSDAIESVSKVEAVDADTVKHDPFRTGFEPAVEPDRTSGTGVRQGRRSTTRRPRPSVPARTPSNPSIPGNKIVLKANAKYWGTAHKAQTDKVVVRFFSDDNAAVNALKSGDVDVLSPVNATLGQVAQTVDSIEVSAAIRQRQVRARLQLHRIRSLPTSACARRSATPSTTRRSSRPRGNVDQTLGGPIPSVDPGYEDLTGLYPYDPCTRPRNCMGEAGYSVDKPLKLTLTYANTYGTELGDQLQQPARQGRHRPEHQLCGILHYGCRTCTPMATMSFRLVDHAESHDFYSWTNPEYYFHYNSKKVQELYAKSLASTDSATSEKYLKQAARIVSEDAPADWLFGYRVTVARDKNLHGFPGKLTQILLPLWQVYKTK